MKKFLFVISFLFSLLLAAQGYVNPNNHWVNGYYRSNGTYVEGHYRTNPNHTNRDNYSTRGNTNPYTGKRGWVTPDNYPVTYPSTYSYPSNSNSSSEYRGSSYNSGYTSEYKTSRITNNRGVIQYLDGKDDFGVTRERLRTNSNELTLYYYDPLADEVASSKSIPTGLLLHGNRTIADDKGNIIISNNYDKGRLHGLQIIYGEDGEVSSKSIMRYGEVISYETYDEEGEKWRFEKESAYTKMTFYRGESIRKIVTEYPSGTEIIEEFDDGEEELDYKYGMVDGLLQGPFSVFYANGIKKRIGNFDLGMLQGQVKNYSPNGQIFSLETYDNDVMDGPYLQYEDGQVTTKGQYKNGLRNGRWNYYFHDTRGSYVYQFVTYSEDRLNGPFQLVSFDTIRVGNYLLGEYQGPMKVYRSRDVITEKKPNRSLLPEELIEEGNYQNGTKSGIWREYYYPGLLKAEGAYSNGKKNGEWRFYTSNESTVSPWLFLVENYHRDQKHGKFQFFRNKDQLAVDGFYKWGKEHGLITLYDEDGWRMETNYVNGVKSGTHMVYAADGQIYLSGYYENGEPSSVWREYFLDKPNVVYAKTIYDGQNKKVEIYNEQAQLTCKAQYEADQLLSFQVFDLATGKVKEDYYKFYAKRNEIYFTLDTYSEEQKFVSRSLLELDEDAKADELDLFILYQESDGFLPYTPHGSYSVMDIRTGRTHISGNYHLGKRNSIWKQFVETENITRVMKFTNGHLTLEHFELTTNSQLPKGKFTFTNLEGQTEEIRLKKGLRHGKTKVFSVDGSLIREERYKNGVIK